MPAAKYDWDSIIPNAIEIVNECRNMQELAVRLNCDRRSLASYVARRVICGQTETVFDAFRRSVRMGIFGPLLKRPRKRKCAFCGRAFIAASRHSDQRFCSESCGSKWQADLRGRTRIEEGKTGWVSWNEHFFDKLTSDSGYILGFLIADGHIRNSFSGRGTRNHTIAIHQKNPLILQKMAVALGYTGHLQDAGNSPTTCLRLGSKHAWETLTGKYEIPAGRAKSYIVHIPNIILKDEVILPHFIRGLFDGDGHISGNGYQTWFTSGSERLVDDFIQVLVDYADLPRRKRAWEKGGYIKKNGERSGSWFVRWSAPHDSMKFAKYIYGPALDVYGSNLYLERKRERFAQLFTPWRDPDWLKEEFIKKGKSAADIAKDFDDAAPHQVGMWLSKYGLGKSRDWLYELYWNRGLNAPQIAILANTSTGTIYNWMKQFDIPRRPIAEARKLRRGTTPLISLNAEEEKERSK